MGKRPRDPNQLAKLVVDIATGESSDDVSDSKKRPSRIRGRAGGLRGGSARAQALSSKRRKSIARKAAKARWNRDR